MCQFVVLRGNLFNAWLCYKKPSTIIISINFLLIQMMKKENV